MTHLTYKILSQYAALKSEVFFVNVGSNDGKTHDDPLYPHIVSNGWHGLLIEPQENVFALLSESYKDIPNTILENVAIHSGDEKHITLYVPILREGETWVNTGTATIHHHIARRRGQREQFTPVIVRAVKLGELLDHHNIRRVDVILIDVEGADDMVIRQIHELEMTPNVIIFEHYHIGVVSLARTLALLRSDGYRLFVDGGNIIAVQKEVEDCLPENYVIHHELPNRFMRPNTLVRLRIYARLKFVPIVGIILRWFANRFKPTLSNIK